MNVVPTSDFFHGVALVRVGNTDDGIIKLIDKTGKVISSPENGEYDNIVTIIPEYGYTIVYKKLVTFQLTEEQAGVIDNRGNWHIPLTNNPVLVDYAKYTAESSSTHARYIGEGVLALHEFRNYKYARDASLHLLNIIDGNTWTVEFGTLVNDSNLLLAIEGQIRNIVNGTGMFVATWYSQNSLSSLDGNIYTINIFSGEINLIISNVSRIISDSGGNTRQENFSKISSDLFYVGGRFRETDDKQGFYDLTGLLVIDLSGYDIRNDNRYMPEFSKGYAFLQLSNPQGTAFYTVIDNMGDFMFEPREMDGDPSFRNISEGLLVSGSSNTPDGRKSITIMNAYGDTVTEITAEAYSLSVSDFINGVAKVILANESRSGQRAGDNVIDLYYIDTQGNRLF